MALAGGEVVGGLCGRFISEVLGEGVVAGLLLSAGEAGKEGLLGATLGAEDLTAGVMGSLAGVVGAGVLGLLCRAGVAGLLCNRGGDVLGGVTGSGTAGSRRGVTGCGAGCGAGCTAGCAAG